MIPPTPDLRGFGLERPARIRRRHAISVLALTLVAFAALAVAVGVTVSAPPDLLERKVAAAERHLYYRITHTTGPVFELDGSETSLRLVVHAVVPGATTYDPLREIELGARVELLGDAPWRRDIYTRARQSKARPIVEHGSQIWLDENTFSLHRGIELTDDRQLVVPLPVSIKPGTRVRVTLLGDVQDGIVRGYTPVPRANVGRRLDAMRPVDREHTAAQLGVEPWDQLTVARELAALRYAEHRLSAEGEEGDDYQIREVYTTGFRSREDRIVDSGVLVAADRAAAINVVGPAQVELGARRADVLDREMGTLAVGFVGEGAAVAPVQLALPYGDTLLRHTISVPKGVFTLDVSATRPARIELGTTQPVALGGTTQLVPDVQRLTTYVTDNSGEPVRIALEGPHDQLGRAVRIDVRALGARDLTLMLDAVDGDKHVKTIATRIESELSRFELAQLANQQEARVAEPVAVRFVAPAGARELRVRSEGRALVTLSTPLGAATPDVLEPPYAGIALTTLLWRYPRFAERGWVTMRPSNAELLATDRVVTVLAQPRLEPREVVPPAETVGSSLAPTERLERQTIIERVTAADAAGVLARWSGANFTRIAPGKSVTLDFARLPDRPALAYYATSADADVVGEPITVKIDGKALDTIVLPSPGGTLDLPRGLAGKHEIVVETQAPVRLFVDRPPVGSGAELYALRTVYRVPDDGQRFRIKVTKRGAAVQNVNLVLYTPSSIDSTTLRVTIDGGSPARIEGVALTKWTLADRTVPLPPSHRPATLGFTDVARGGPLRPHLLAIALGDDVLPGEHVVELRVNGPRPIWGRFFVLDGGTPTARATQWRDWSDP